METMFAAPCSQSHLDAGREGLDVRDPLVVRVAVVAAHRRHLHSLLLELVDELGHAAQLGGANRGEVG